MPTEDERRTSSYLAIGGRLGHDLTLSREREMIRFSRAAAALTVSMMISPNVGIAQPHGFRVGEPVQIEASNHWVPCVVVETAPPGDTMLVKCSAYPALSRGEGVYRVPNRTGYIRKTGAIGKSASATQATPAPARSATAGAAISGLKLGEYACYGGRTGSGAGQAVGGRSVLLAGAGFTVRPGGRYVDLDGKNPGTFTVSGSTVTFRGGIHGGSTGRSLRNGSFVLGAKVVCEPW